MMLVLLFLLFLLSLLVILSIARKKDDVSHKTRTKDKPSQDTG